MMKEVQSADANVNIEESSFGRGLGVTDQEKRGKLDVIRILRPFP